MPAPTQATAVGVEVGALLEPEPEGGAVGLVLRGEPGLRLPVGPPVLPAGALRGVDGAPGSFAPPPGLGTVAPPVDYSVYTGGRFSLKAAVASVRLPV